MCSSLIFSDEPAVHKWTYPGQCPHTVGEWAWVPFRNHCYAFNLHSLKLQQDARMSCKKGGGTISEARRSSSCCAACAHDTSHLSAALLTPSTANRIDKTHQYS